MEALMAEMERKRKQLDSTKTTAKKKYFKRGDLAAEMTAKIEEKEEKQKNENEVVAGGSGEGESDYIKNLIKPISEKSEQK